MRTISAADANRYFSRLLREVKAGETVVVTSRGEPVARIEPARSADADDAERRRAFAELLAHLNTVKPLNLGRITRDEIYDD